MRILGIDPGTNVLGYAVIEADKKNIQLLTMSVVLLDHLEEHQHRLKRIFEKVQMVAQEFEPTELAIEAPFFGKNPQSMLKLGRAQGVAMAAAMLKGLNVTEYAPRSIKQSVTGNGNASKEQVAAMLENVLKQSLDVKYFDATDALAVAVAHFYQQSNVLKGIKKADGWKSFLNANPDRIVK
jgi:crossover junction endodeoxyribonuclease RuvC